MSATALPRKKLPIGIQTFAEIRQDGCYDVYKTALIVRMATEGKYYFLSRPRRFGKSLLIDTIGELFAGNRGLFAGLYADAHWDWSVRFPVVRLSFGKGVLHTRSALDQSIHAQLVGAETRAGLTPVFSDIGSRFGSRATALVRAPAAS